MRCGSSIPQAADAGFVEDALVRDEDKVPLERLRHEEPIERIGM
jgi:hypothetical protein